MAIKLSTYQQNQQDLLNSLDILAQKRVTALKVNHDADSSLSLASGRFHTDHTDRALTHARQQAEEAESIAYQQTGYHIDEAQQTINEVQSSRDLVESYLRRMQELAINSGNNISQYDQHLLDVEYQGLKDDIRTLIDQNLYLGQNSPALPPATPPGLEGLISQLQDFTLIAKRPLIDHGSTRLNGGFPNRNSTLSNISDDGRYVLFQTDANNIGVGGPGNRRNIYLKDRLTGNIQQIDTTNGGIPANGNSTWSHMSADASVISFITSAPNLGASGGRQQGYIYRQATNSLELVTENLAGNPAIGTTTRMKLSADGQFAAFISTANDLVAGDTHTNGSDVFVKNLTTGTIELVSRSTAGIIGNGTANEVAISADGRYVTFSSNANNLSPTSNDGGRRDIFVHDRVTGTTNQINLTAGGLDGNNNVNSWLAISNDGQRVAYTSDATNIDGAHPVRRNQVYLYDAATGTNRLVSHQFGSNQGGNRNADQIAMSGDGTKIAYRTQASNLEAIAHPNFGYDVIQYDVATDTNTKASTNYDTDLGNSYNTDIRNPHFSNNGDFLTFQTGGGFYPTDPTNRYDIYIHNQGGNDASASFRENQYLSFNFSYTSSLTNPLTAISYAVNNISNSPSTVFNTTGILDPIGFGATQNIEDTRDLDLYLAPGSNGDTSTITLDLSVNGTIYAVEFEPFTVGTLTEGTALRAVSVDGTPISNMPPPPPPSIISETAYDIRVGTSILSEDEIQVRFAHLDLNALDPNLANTHLRTPASRTDALTSLSNSLDYIDKYEASLSSIQQRLTSAAGGARDLSFQFALGSDRLALPALPDPERLVGEAELYEQFSQGLAIEHAIFMEKHVETLFDHTAPSFEPEDNPILGSWNAYFDQNPEPNKT